MDMAANESLASRTQRRWKIHDRAAQEGNMPLKVMLSIMNERLATGDQDGACRGEHGRPLHALQTRGYRAQDDL